MSREESPSSEDFKFLISSLFIPGSISFLQMIQNFLPLASEFHPSKNIITCILKANILLQKYWLFSHGISLYLGNCLGGCEILKTKKQDFKRRELFAHCFYAS